MGREPEAFVRREAATVLVDVDDEAVGLVETFLPRLLTANG
jgi:hypothetical protein